MTNPVFGNDKAFQGGYAGFGEQRSAQAYPSQPGQSAAYGQQPPMTQMQYGSPAPYAGQNANMSAEQLEHMYRGDQQVGRGARMGIDDVIVRTGIMFGIILVTGAVAWWTANSLLLIVGVVGGLVLGLINAFKREPSAPLILAYAAFEGLFLGGISRVFEAGYPGIVVQAVLATVAVFGVTLALFSSGRFRPTPKLTKMFMIALGGYMLFSLLNLGLMFFGVLDGWGMRSGPLGIAIGAFAVLLATYSLVLDFDYVEQGVRAGLPEKYAWKAAFGLVVTLVWMYLEILRILAILRGD